MTERERKIARADKQLRKEILWHLKELPTATKARLHKRSRRVKAMMRRALAARRSYDYMALRALCKAYGDQIARKMPEILG